MKTYSNLDDRQRVAYERWIAELLKEKVWKAYFVTFMYEPLPGGESAMLRQMEREIERFYAILLTRVIRNPRQPSKRDKLPRLFAAPDRPVPKREKQSMEDVVINDGLHCHAVVLIPRKSRLPTGLRRHVNDNIDLYLGSQGKLRRIHVKRIRHGAEKVADYLLKAWRRAPSLSGELLVLPQALSELPQAANAR